MSVSILAGCVEQTSIPDMMQDMSTAAVDLKEFNCETDRIDPTSKKTWRGRNYYWDCKLQTYCTPEIINNELLCVPKLTDLYEDTAYYDNKCEFPINGGLTHILFNNGNDIEVPLHTKFIGGSYGIWYTADPLYLGEKLDTYSIYNITCQPTQSTDPILYIEDLSARLTIPYLYKINWQWK